MCAAALHHAPCLSTPHPGGRSSLSPAKRHANSRSCMPSSSQQPIQVPTAGSHRWPPVRPGSTIADGVICGSALPRATPQRKDNAPGSLVRISAACHFSRNSSSRVVVSLRASTTTTAPQQSPQQHTKQSEAATRRRHSRRARQRCQQRRCGAWILEEARRAAQERSLVGRRCVGTHLFPLLRRGGRCYCRRPVRGA